MDANPMERASDLLDSSLLATVTRSGQPESWHRGMFAVVEGDRVIRSEGDIQGLIYARSSVKPFQALPLLERGIVDRESFSDAELAVISASHNGTREHQAVVQALLERGGFQESDLLCGPHSPFDIESGRELVRAGKKPSRIHNNCSGKHAGFLWLARELGVPLPDYLDPESASQLVVRESVCEMAGVALDAVDAGVDGCGAPTLRLPLVGLARAFSRMTNPDDLSPVRSQACRRMLNAVSHHPVLLAGRGRFCTALIESAPGRVYPKNGAEGVYAVGLAGMGIGIAIKILDGEARAYPPVVVEILRGLGLWEEIPASLEDFARVPIRSTRKDLVGHIESAFRW